MSLPFLFAKRYLFSLKKLSFISIITSLSFLGLVIGVAALISVTSIFNGFRYLVKDVLLGVDPHIRITSTKGSYIQDKDKLYSTLLSIPTIDTIYSISLNKVVVSNKNILQAGVLFAKQFEKDTVYKSNHNSVKIGIGLADKLQVKRGDTLSLFSPAMLEASSSGLFQPTGIMVIIDEIFQVSSGVNYDDFYILSKLPVAYLLNGNIVTGYDLKLNNIDDLKSTVALLKSILPATYTIDTWETLHQDLYSTMEFERNASFIVISLVACVSAFNILISLWLTVRKKKKDIAILQTMGMTNTKIQQVFLFEGMIIGFSGTAIGFALGIALCIGQQKYGWISLPNSIVPSMPIHISSIDITIACLFSLLISVIATIYPSIQSIRTSISDALRSE